VLADREDAVLTWFALAGQDSDITFHISESTLEDAKLCKTGTARHEMLGVFNVRVRFWRAGRVGLIRPAWRRSISATPRCGLAEHVHK
jgi:hypothetical protein